MLNWRKVCTVLSVLLLVTILLLNQFGSPLACYRLEKQVYSHLQAQGYQQEDIAEMKVYYDRNARNKYVAEVQFTSMPDRLYHYCYDSDQQIQETEQISS